MLAITQKGVIIKTVRTQRNTLINTTQKEHSMFNFSPRTESRIKKVTLLVALVTAIVVLFKQLRKA